MSKQPMRGWTQPGGSRKFHYFLDAAENPRSMCGRWMVLGPDPDEFDDDLHEHGENCSACQRKRAALPEEPRP